MIILCIGNSAYDITSIVEEYPKENYKYRVIDQIECGGGSCGNTAYLLAKWGLNTYYAGMVGDDYFGKKIRDEFRTIGVKTNYFILNKDFKTITSQIIINQNNGSRTILSYHPDNYQMPDIDIDIVPDIIYLDGREYNMAKKCLEKYPNALSIIDAGNDKKEVIELCSMCNYVICSKDFMEKVSGIPIINYDTLYNAFNKLNGMFNTNLIVTLEDKGCAYYDNNEVKIIPSIKVKVKDTTAAGDIFHGAFVYAISNKFSLIDSLKFSNCAAALSITRYGGRNSIFDLKDVLEVYNEIK